MRPGQQNKRGRGRGNNNNNNGNNGNNGNFNRKKTTGGSSLSQSEMDALRGQIQKNWSVISGIEGAEGVIIKVTMKLDQNGEIIGQPDVEASGGSDSARRTLQSSALRAVRRSAPFKGLPPDKYDAWSEVVVNFDPSELL